MYMFAILAHAVVVCVAIEDVARRKKLFKLARKKVDGLTEAEERGLGSYKLIVRSLVVLVLEIYLALLRAVEKVSPTR
jgi:hypothetical protein